MVLNLIDKEPGIKAPKIAELVQKGLSTVERYIKKLRDQNYIEFRGAAKNGGYHRKA
jgi:ATP-dependent DNA helicase RecG